MNVEWVAGMFQLPLPLPDEDGAPVQPSVALFLELPARVIVKSFAIDPRNPERTFGEMAREAMDDPLKGKARQPKSIRVPTADLAAELRHELGDRVEIEIGPTPELEEIFAGLCEHLEREFFTSDVARLSESLPAPLLEELFETAHDLFRAAPWKSISEIQLVKVDLSAFGAPDATLAVMGAYEVPYGVILSRSFDVHGPVVPLSDHVGDRWEKIAIFYERRDEIPDVLLDEIDEHRWKVAGKKAYPMFNAMTAGGPRLPAGAEARLLIDAVRALLNFHRIHASLFRRQDAEPCSMTVKLREGVEIDLSAPWPAVFPDEIDDEFDEDLDEDAVYAEIDEISEAFRRSDEARRLAGWSPEWLSAVLDVLGDYGFKYFGARLTELEVGEVDEIVFDLYPSKVTIEDAAEADQIWNELIAVWRWLEREHLNPNASAVLQMLEGHGDEFREAMLDEENWGPAKRFATAALRSGVDVNDSEAMSRFLDQYNDDRAMQLQAAQAPRQRRNEERTRKKKKKMEKQSRRRNRRR